MPRKLAEEWYPRALGGMCFIVLLCSDYKSLATLGKESSSAVLVMGSIFCGFLATAFSILYASAGSDKIKTMKTSGAFQGIVAYLWESMLWNLIAIFVALVSIFFPYELAPYSKYISTLMLSVGCCSFFAMYRVTKLYMKVLLL